MNLYLGIFLLEVRDHRRQHIVSDGRACAHADATLYQPRKFTDILLGRGKKSEDLLGVLIKHFAGWREDHGAGRPVEEFGLVDLLQGLYLQAHGRLSEVYDLRGL